MNDNLSAFLATIRHSEVKNLPGAQAYAATFGCNVTNFLISDFSDHPALLGWGGVRLDGTEYASINLGSQYAGEISTAAGAYQLIKPTWVTLKARLGLLDFSPYSQDAAAIELIREAGALDLVTGGQVVDALERCHGIWASLPGSSSGQPQTNMSDLVQCYTAAGGGFA